MRIVIRRRMFFFINLIKINQICLIVKELKTLGILSISKNASQGYHASEKLKKERISSKKACNFFVYVNGNLRMGQNGAFFDHLWTISGVKRSQLSYLILSLKCNDR